jgi:hypothetical protein
MNDWNSGGGHSLWHPAESTWAGEAGSSHGASIFGLSTRIHRVDANLTAGIDRIQSELTGRMVRIQADLAQFYRTLGEHDANIDFLMSDRPEPKN